MVNFQLFSSPIELDAIIVTGTAGETQNRAIGNAVSQIKANEVVARRPSRTSPNSSGAVGTAKHRELWLEGHRLADMHRRNDPLLAGGDECFPISQNEIDTIPNL